MTKFANRKRQSSPIQPWDYVYLKIRPHRFGFMPARFHPKQSTCYCGPYMVLKQVRAVAFKLQLQDQTRIHLIFHVSYLKSVMGNHVVEPEIPAEFEVEAPNYQSIGVLGSRKNYST